MGWPKIVLKGNLLEMMSNWQISIGYEDNQIMTRSQCNQHTNQEQGEETYDSPQHHTGSTECASGTAHTPCIDLLEGFKPPNAIQGTQPQEGQKPSAYICNIAHGKGMSTGRTNAPAYPLGVQVTLPEDSAASVMLQETVPLASMDFGDTEVEFEGELNGPMELAMAATANTEDDIKSVEHAKQLNDWPE